MCTHAVCAAKADRTIHDKAELTLYPVHPGIQLNAEGDAANVHMFLTEHLPYATLDVLIKRLNKLKIPKTKKTPLAHRVVRDDPDRARASTCFVTTPRIDAYEPYESRSWGEFCDALRKQALNWGPNASKKNKRHPSYRYPAIGFYGCLKYAVYIEKGDPAMARSADMQIVELSYPDSWNVT